MQKETPEQENHTLLLLRFGVSLDAGQSVCWPAFNKLLGTSKRTTTKSRFMALDMRRSIDDILAPRDSPQQQKVHENFLGLYKSVAEPLPHEHYMVRGSVDKNTQINEDMEFQRSGGEDDENVDVWNPDRPITNDLVACLGGDIGGAKRYLPNNAKCLHCIGLWRHS